MSDDAKKKDALLAVCEEFIRDEKINAPEDICQSDNVILNAYSFIYRVCEIVGYHSYDD